MEFETRLESDFERLKLILSFEKIFWGVESDFEVLKRVWSFEKIFWGVESDFEVQNGA